MYLFSFDPIIAEAYRRAALDGLDMCAFAGQMDRVKKTIQTASDFYKQWERLDDLIGETVWLANDPTPIQLVRQVLVSQLDERLADTVLAPDAEHWQRWRTAFSDAVFHWRPEAMRALCTAPVLEKKFGKRLEPFRQFFHWFCDRRWVETQAVFEDLANDTTLPGEQRGYFNYVCGQIDLYFHYRYAQAKTLFETAQAQLSGKPLALHGLVEYYLKGPDKDKNPERARALVDEALLLDPNDSTTLILKGDVLAEKGDLAEAENQYRLASRKRPGQTLCYTRLIDLFGKPEWFEKKEPELAGLLDIVGRLEPVTGYLTWSDIATIYQQAPGKAFLEKAETFHREAIQRYPQGITAALNLGYFFLDYAGKPEEAEAIFKEVVQRAPDAREAYLALARLHETREQWEAMIPLYEKVQQIIPSWDRYMLTGISRCLRQMNRLEEAEKLLLQAWALDEYDDSGALNELYELTQNLYKGPGQPQPDHAVQLLENAAQQRSSTPANAAGLANRQGHALFYFERYAEALPYYQKAAALMPNEPVYFTNQFDCLENMYRQSFDAVHFEKALEALNRAAQLAPQDASIPKLQRRLAMLRYNPQLANLPLLYHVHVEVGPPLVSQITQDYATLLPEMNALTDALRARMRQRFAINLPGLRYRDIQDGDGAYQFRLYETPVVYDHLPAPENQPFQMAAVLDELEFFISNYCLDLFVNYWDVDNEVPLLPNAELVHFTRVVMALLAEQVPLPPLPELHQYYRQIDGARRPVAVAVEQLRLQDALRAGLPGVQAGYLYIRLSEEQERLLEASLVGAGDTRALALAAPYADRFVEAVSRVALEKEETPVALVTNRETLRPFLRSILAAHPRCRY
ncbi:MAG: tetratricopeptide repeat protein [Saprospirales bacterium]|nr:tetratricopeptide repeat protein [Saprospirales bacterium]